MSMKRGACVLAAAAALSFAAGISQAQAAVPHGWRLAEVYGKGAQNFDPSWPGGLAVPSSNRAWMIRSGCTWPCNPGNPVTVTEYWNGHLWAPVPARELRGMSPAVVTASSPKDAWLFGRFPGMRYAGALHWNGVGWSKRAVPGWLIQANGSGGADIYTADFSPRQPLGVQP
jgi:hypothetical protein